MVDSDPEFARVVKGRIEKTTLGEVHTVYYTSVFYMCLFIWIKWKFMIKLTETMVHVYVIKILRSFDVRKLKIQHTDILIIFYWFTGIGIHWRSVSAWWLLYSCEIRYGQNSTSKGVCKESILIPMIVWALIGVIPNLKLRSLTYYM